MDHTLINALLLVISQCSSAYGGRRLNVLTMKVWMNIQYTELLE